MATKIRVFNFYVSKRIGSKNYRKISLSPNYGRLSILTNLRLNISETFLVKPNSFFPQPKVKSMVLHFKPKSKILYGIKKIENLEKVTNIIFSNKRKMIKKNIKKLLSKDRISNINNLRLDLRPMDLSPQIYYKITELYEKK